jgi:hemolysin III
MFNKLRDPVSGLTHLFGGIAAFAGLIALLVIGRGDAGKQISLFIYGLSLMLMFSASAGYHLTQAGPKVLQILRKLDHTAIYLLIAGTYTPICFVMFAGFWKWGMLAIIWALAIIGVTVKIFVINAPRWVNAGVYLIMGWLALAAITEMLHVMSVGALLWLLAGGIAFTLGAIIYITKIMDFVPGVFGFHEVWHIFVLLGCAAHFVLILVYATPHVRVL